MKKLLLYLFTFIFLINSILSVTIVNISSCPTTLNLSYNGGAGTKYVLNQSINISGATCLTIGANDIYLDGKGYSITGNKAYPFLGIISNGFSNLVLKNLNITKFYEPIRFSNSDNNLVENSNFSDNNINVGAVIDLYPSSNNIFNNLRIFNNAQTGIRFQSNSNNNTINNSIFYDNQYGGSFYLNSVSSCGLKIINTTDNNGKFHFFSNTSVNINGWTNLSSIYLCNSNNSIIKNINFTSNNLKGVPFQILGVNNSNFLNINITKFSYQMYMRYSNNNNFSNINLKDGNSGNLVSFYLYYSNNNNLDKINITNSFNGFYILNSNYNIVNNSYIDSYYSGIYFNSNFENTIKNTIISDYLNQYFIIKNCNVNIIENITSPSGKLHLFYNYSINLSNLNNVKSIYLCNADNSNLENITIDGINDKGTFLTLNYVDNSNFKNISITNYDAGIRNFNSKNNNFSNLNLTSNYAVNSGQIRFDSNSNNNSVFNSYIKLGSSDIFFSNSKYNKFYNNFLVNDLKIYNNNWGSYPNYFNYTIPGIGNVGNFWDDLGNCLSKKIVGDFSVCTNPNNYSVNLANNIFDYAPLVVPDPIYVYPTLLDNSKTSKINLTFKIKDYKYATNVKVEINGTNYSMIQLGNYWYYNYIISKTSKTKYNFMVYYNINQNLSLRTFTYYPSTQVFENKVPAFGFGSFVSFLILIIGGFLFN